MQEDAEDDPVTTPKGRRAGRAADDPEDARVVDATANAINVVNSNFMLGADG